MTENDLKIRDRKNLCLQRSPAAELYDTVALPRTRLGLVIVMAMTAAWLSVQSTTLLAQRNAKGSRELPRFVSLKSNPVNLRTGPGRRYPKAWEFRRAGLPVEIIQEQQAWRRIRDSEGASGWILGALLSRRRTALILPWEAHKAKVPVYVDLKRNPRAGAETVARLEAGALASVKSCDRVWCRVRIRSYSGYIPQKQLWGVYPDEIVK